MIKKIRRTLLRKNNGGFTLSEVIVSSALVGILLVGMMAFITPAMNMMHSEEVDGRAKTVAETIDSYINGSLRNAVYVAMFEHANMADDINDMSGAIYNNTALYNMKEFVKKPGNSTVYELRCIAIRRMYDDKRQEFKYVVTSETPMSDSVMLDAGKSYQVFDMCFYDKLYPEISLKRLTNQVDGEPALDPADVKDVPAMETAINIYNDDDMSEDSLILVGKGYINFINIRSGILNSGDFKIYPEIDTHVRTADEAKAAYSYAGDTFIYYVTRKATYNTTP
ncbi:MAG: type II secretion system protein [Oscillospiraceae bacterium]